ncbi:MAG TPA: CoA ester lyase [Terriglobia bacterium]|nr:CoA ester lyase [Terriglobia bacterium]
MRPIRSLLFAPANRHELIGKFFRYSADAFAIDLEDGVPEAEKEAARRSLPDVIASLRQQNLKGPLFLRTNAPRSRQAEADLAAAVDMRLAGAIMPKLETTAELRQFATAGIPIIGVIETARGVANVEALAVAQSSHLAALAFGAEDFITDVGGLRTPEGLEVLYARSRVVLAARASGLQALDLVYVNIRDDEGFRRDAQMGRQLGYSGKMCIVPRQVEIANAVFSPSAEERENARRLLAAFDSAQASGRGVFEFDGGMVDEPIIKRARQIADLGKD